MSEKTFLEHLPDEAIISKEAVAEYLHMPVKRLVEIASGRERSGLYLPCHRVSARHYLFKVGDVRKFLDSCYTGQ